MLARMSHTWTHPRLSRRAAVQAGAIGLLGLGMNHVAGLQAAATEGQTNAPRPRFKAAIYIFLSGGLGQHDSFDPKPDAPDNIRGEFSSIATQTAGARVCEHLPMLAARSNQWALVRSLSHPYNEHSIGHHVMLTGRTDLPPGFSSEKPTPNDYPSFAAIANAVIAPRNNLPPAAVLPEKLVHVTGRTIPGQFAGQMGWRHDPWFIEASRFKDTQYIHGAMPEYTFQRWEGKTTVPGYIYEAPRLELPHEVLQARMSHRLDLLRTVDSQRRDLDATAGAGEFGRLREDAVALLTSGGVHRALDVHGAPDDLQDRYGRNSFGWSLLMARQLVEAGVSLVQVNLGNDETWDTHERAFYNLQHFLYPPTDRAVSALIDDLSERGLLDDVLIVMAGEFGRTPRVFVEPSLKSKTPGRDHWGAVQSVFFAGGGVRGGTVIGATDKIGGYPIADRQTPENMAATIYQSLGLPRTIAWYDDFNRPHQVYHGEPIAGLCS